MTVSSTTIKTAPYACDGVTVQFAFPWGVWDSSEVKVILRMVSDGTETTLTETTHYSVTLSNDMPSAGYITTVAAYSALYEIVIKADFPETQEVDYGEGDKFPSASHEEALDRGVRLVQQLSERFSRSVLFPETTTLEDIELPEISVTVGGFFLGVDAAGDALSWGEPTDIGNLTAHTSDANAHTALVDALTARTNTGSAGLALVASATEVATGNEATKTVSPSGLASMWQYATIQIPAGSLRPSSSVAGTQSVQEYLRDYNGASPTLRDYVEFAGSNSGSKVTTEMYDATLIMPDTWDRATLKCKAVLMPSYDSTVTAGSVVEIGFFAKAYNSASLIDTNWSSPVYVTKALDNAATNFEYETPASANLASSVPGSINRIDIAVARRNSGISDGTPHHITERNPIWLTHLLVQYKNTNQASAW